LDGYYPLKAKVMEMKRRDFILTTVRAAKTLTKPPAGNRQIPGGRYTCLARKPRCEVCLINDLCRWPDKTV
jgi:adenine-specific DNA glycosylase